MTATERSFHRRRHRRAVLALALTASGLTVNPTQTPALSAKAEPVSPVAAVSPPTAIGVDHVAPRLRVQQRPVHKRKAKAQRRRKPARTTVRVNGVPAVWLRLVECEAGGDWAYGGPDGHSDPGYRAYEGGPNFTAGTWLAYRLPGYPRHAYDATPLQQVAVAKRVLRAQGVKAWPICGPRSGLRLADAA